MHIGIDATALYGHYNGVERALWNSLRGLAALQSKHFFSAWIPHDGPAPEELNFGARWRWHRLPFAGTSKARRIAWQQTYLPRLLKREACDVLYAPTYVSPLCASVPVVLTVYDLIALNQPQFATRANRLHYGAVLPAAMRHATRIIVPSAPVADDVGCFTGADKIHVIEPGVEDIFCPATPQQIEAIRAQYDLPREYILFVGTREPKKNLPRLLEALELVARRRAVPPLVIAGEARAWGDDLQVPRGVSVRRLGYVPRASLPALMSGCTAFVFPSLAEGFGLPVLEALACGAPVVASTAVPIPNLEEAALLCDPTNVELISGAIEQLLNDSGNRADLSQRACRFAGQYPVRRSAQMTLRVLEEAEHAVRLNSTVLYTS
jgi:glycosyltransferase involved in cell wall biosynthesis